MIIIPRVERAWAQMLGKAPSRCRAKPLQRLLFSEGDKPFVIILESWENSALSMQNNSSEEHRVHAWVPAGW